MGLEVATYIADLVDTNPTGADDYSTADDHLRLVKEVLQNSFPNINGAMTADDEDLNLLDGAVAAGVTAAEIAFLDGVTSAIQTQMNLKFDAAGVGRAAQADAEAATSNVLWMSPLRVDNWYDKVFITKRKDGDTTRNTTTLTDDDDLIGYALEAETHYVIEGLLIFGNATGTPPDIKWEFQVVSGNVDRFRMLNIGGHNSLGSNTLTTLAPVSSVTGQNTLNLDANTADHAFTLRGFIDTGVTGPVLDMQWASIAASGNVTLEQDSWISFRRIP